MTKTANKRLREERRAGIRWLIIEMKSQLSIILLTNMLVFSVFPSVLISLPVKNFNYDAEVEDKEMPYWSGLESLLTIGIAYFFCMLGILFGWAGRKRTLSDREATTLLIIASFNGVIICGLSFVQQENRRECSTKYIVKGWVFGVSIVMNAAFCFITGLV